MQNSDIRMGARMSRGRLSRLQKAARYAVVGSAVALIGTGSALAECRRPTNPFGAGGSVLDLIPLASGTAINSIIATIGSVNSSSLAQSSAFATGPGGTQQDVDGGGRWSRIVAGTDEVNADTRATATALGVGLGTESCRSTTKLDYVVTQAGVDVGRFRFNNGANFQWGFTAGYVDAQAKDKTPGVGTFSSENQVGFAGIYMAMSKGNFAFDAQLRGDYFSMELNDADTGLFSQPLTARGAALLANLSYRFDLQNNWFVEPSLGMVLSHTDVNQLDVDGAINLPPAVSPGFTFPGTVNIGGITSNLGRATLRVGTTIVTPTIAWQPFGTVSVFHEFADSVQTAVSTRDLALPLDAAVTTDRVGTYGHVGLGIAGVLLNTGWLGYVRGDYRFGDNIEAYSVNAGLRYQFEPRGVAGSVKDGGAGYSEAPFNWTGPYIGMSSGAAFGQQDWTFGNGAVTSPEYAGFMVGGQVGYDMQFGSTVVGVEADYNWTNAQGGESCPNAFRFSCIAEVDNLSFITARLGFTSGRALYYLKGGLAMAEVSARGQDNQGGFAGPVPQLFNPSETQIGYAFGGGMEFAIDDRWSARGEILHYNLGTERFLLQAPNIEAEIETTGNVARIGLNYRFGGRGAHHHAEPMK